MDRNQLEFVLYCVESLADNLKKDPIEVYELLKNSGILYEYIVPSYDVLHTQGRDYIVDDILMAMKKKGVA